MVSGLEILFRIFRREDLRRLIFPLRLVFAGKDPSRALATSSLKAEDCTPEWADLDDSAKTVLSEWYTFFSKRYNIVGKVRLIQLPGPPTEDPLR
jgi:hypothetical protein